MHKDKGTELICILIINIIKINIVRTICNNTTSKTTSSIIFSMFNISLSMQKQEIEVTNPLM